MRPASELAAEVAPWLPRTSVGDYPRDALAELEARLVRAEEALERISEQQPKTLDWMQANGIVLDNLHDHWQKVAFSIYTDLCEADSIARAALSGEEAAYVARGEAAGYWVERNGQREWRDSPRCPACNGETRIVDVADKELAAAGDVIARVECSDCGAVLVSFLRPSEAALAYGRKLARERNWKDVIP